MHKSDLISTIFRGNVTMMRDFGNNAPPTSVASSYEDNGCKLYERCRTCPEEICVFESKNPRGAINEVIARRALSDYQAGFSITKILEKHQISLAVFNKMMKNTNIQKGNLK